MIFETCVRRPVFATMLVMSLLVLGIFSFRDLGGAGPEEIRTAVVIPLENALSGIAGIDQMTSYCNRGWAGITIRFVLERDLEDAANAVREKVSAAMRPLPPQVLPPVIQKAD